jgi:hypothetical protein
MGSRITVEESEVGRRRRARLRLNLPAKLVTTQFTCPASILNISEQGIGVVSEIPLKAGSIVVLQFLEFELFCTVAWAKGRRAGLAHDAAITSEIILLLRIVADTSTEDTYTMIAAKDWADGTARFNSTD